MKEEVKGMEETLEGINERLKETDKKVNNLKKKIDELECTVCLINRKEVALFATNVEISWCNMTFNKVGSISEVCLPQFHQPCYADPQIQHTSRGLFFAKLNDTAAITLKSLSNCLGKNVKLVLAIL